LRKPRPTINDVARLASVSKKTVSRVINGSALVRPATREAVEAVIREQGFVPDPQAQALAARRSQLVGLVYATPAPPGFAAVVEGVLDGLKGSGCELVLRTLDADTRSFVERQRLRGLILLAPTREKFECPTVRIDVAQRTDVAELGREAIAHLLSSPAEHRVSDAKGRGPRSETP
jgi:LacI family transcriptional regulator